MKKNRILRGISYILLPILVGILIFSTIYLIIVSQNNYSSKEEYFKSPAFFASYSYNLQDLMNELIFAKEEYYPVNKVGDYSIYYSNFDSYIGLQDYYFLVIYEQKAITNVRVQGIKSIEEIQEYIIEGNEKYLNIEKGQINSNVEKFKESIEDYGYLIGFNVPYYTIDDTPDIVTGVYDYGTETEELYMIPGTDEIYSNDEVNERIYKRAYLNDFSIYTSYKEDFEKGSSKILIFHYLEMFKAYENTIYLSIPISIILILIICIFLINSIGYKKENEELQLADFDKIPIEILLIVFVVILAFSIIILDELDFVVENMQNLIIMFSSFYILNFAIVEIILVTFIKRIKAKSFITTSLIGKIGIKCCGIIKRIFIILRDKIKFLKDKIFQNMGVASVLVGILIYFILNAIFIAVFSFLGVIISLIVFGFILYQIFLRMDNFKNLEKGLQNIYEGNNKDKLVKEEFVPEFRKSVEYVNDISKGFENAVEESLKSERLKTELITNVSHDIKTPLTSIINYVDLLKKEKCENEKAKEYIEILDTKSQRLKKLIDDLVEASKASSGNVKLNLEKIDIVELIKQALGEFEDKFKEKKLEIITELPKAEVKVEADSRYMYRVIENLFSNIAKYALDNSRVYVDAKVINKKIRIEIKNISKERLNVTEEELMQRFVRGDKARATEGSGLGLSIAKSLTTLQGGNLNCKIDGDLFKVEIELNIIK